jgi:hypothetical protein
VLHLPLFRVLTVQAAFGGDASGLADFLRHLERGIAERSSIGDDRTGRQSKLQRVFLPIEIENNLTCCHGGRTSEIIRYRLPDIIGRNGFENVY